MNLILTVIRRLDCLESIIFILSTNRSEESVRISESVRGDSERDNFGGFSEYEDSRRQLETVAEDGLRNTAL